MSTVKIKQQLRLLQEEHKAKNKLEQYLKEHSLEQDRSFIQALMDWTNINHQLRLVQGR